MLGKKRKNNPRLPQADELQGGAVMHKAESSPGRQMKADLKSVYCRLGDELRSTGAVTELDNKVEGQ